MGNLLKKCYNTIDFILEHLATILFMLFFIAILLQVFFRYVLNSPLTWSEEAARYLNIWCVFLGAALAVKRREHLRVDLIDGWVNKWPLRARISFYAILNLACMFFLYFLITGSYHMTLDRWAVKLTMLPLPQGIVYLALLVGATLMFIFLFQQLCTQCKQLISNDEGAS